jgi:hypothetical protein
MNPRKCEHIFLLAAGMGVAVLACVTLTGCTSPSGGMSRDASAAEDIPILWQTSGTHSRLVRRTRILARDQATLVQVPLTEVPVDFETQMVLIDGLGATPSSEQGIRIVRVWRQGSRIRVQERPIHPGTDRNPGLEPASPWTAVVIPKSDLNVEGYSTQVPDGLLRDHAGSR